ncbi:MAG: hypothetical protein WD847_10285 [Pirellulales bacterium]
MQRDTLPIPYEQRLADDPRWALSEGSRHFEEKSAVHECLHRITQRLTEMGIPYAVVGGMALFRYGLRRFTEEVVILVTRKDLNTIHEQLDGRGYVTPFARSRNLRDTQAGVRIEFLIAGQYPGDGKAKPVAFPDPRDVAVEFEGIQYIELAKLVELKLASGMTNPERMKDLADVQELIKLLSLPEEFAAKLDPFVQGRFLDLWKASRAAVKRYVQPLAIQFLTGASRSLPELVASLKKAIDTLQAMQADGVRLEVGDSTASGHPYLLTTDPEVANKHGMREEAEFWNLDDD